VKQALFQLSYDPEVSEENNPSRSDTKGCFAGFHNFFFNLALSSQVEIDFDVHVYVNWYAVPHPWLELPLFDRLNRAVVQVGTFGAANDAQDIYGPILLYND
jgi:hypothetical protein